MRLLNHIETHCINGASLDFGNNVIVSLDYPSVVPASALKYIEENLQKVINGTLSPDAFMNNMKASIYLQYLEDYLEELDCSVGWYF